MTRGERILTAVVVLLMAATAVVIACDSICRLTTDRGCDWPWREKGDDDDGYA